MGYTKLEEVEKVKKVKKLEKVEKLLRFSHSSVSGAIFGNNLLKSYSNDKSQPQVV